MRSHHQPSDPYSIQSATGRAREIAKRIVESAEAFTSDRDKGERKERGECRVCFYLRSSRLGGSATTTWTCGVCARTARHGSTATPRVCDVCAAEHRLCENCGGDQNLNMSRRKYPTLTTPGEKSDE